MKAYNLILMILINISISTALSSDIENPISWPIPDWNSNVEKDKLNSEQCKKFTTFSTDPKTINTDGLLVIKDGDIKYEYYDSQNNIFTPHPLWSISKTITAILLGIAEREGRINLDQNLIDLFPIESNENNLNKIKIKNLLYLDTGYIWNEGNLNIVDNSVIKMLFGTGHKDMASFTAKMKIIKEGPGFKWTYSTGTSTLTMGVLKHIYDSKTYEGIPWRVLFNPLGITNAVFERDLSGTFLGGSGVFTTLRDLAKIGYLLINNGNWNGQQIITEEWIRKMLTPSPGYLSEGTVIKNISNVGVFGGSLWLNKKVKKGFEKPYPFSPDDMYMASGLLGQVVIILPTQKMIIARTGHDTNLNSKLDEFVSRAISCFYDPKYPTAKEIKNTKQRPIGLDEIIKNVKNAIQANTLQGGIAKTICSCHFISKININSCLQRNKLTFSKLLTKIEVKQNVHYDGHIEMQVMLSRFARLFKLNYKNTATAIFDPDHKEYGCTLK